MFESSLIDLGSRKRGGKKLLSIPVAIGLHLVVLAGVSFAQYWQIDRVSEPELNMPPIQVQLSPPVPQPQATRPAAGPSRSALPAAGAPAQPRPATVQPQVIPDTISPVPSAPEPANNGVDIIGLLPATADDTGGGGGGGGGTGGGGGGGINGPGGGGDGADIVYRPGNGISRPVIIDRVDPRYTENARRARLQGTVIVEATIDEQGRVIDIKVLKGLPMGLDDAAVEAVSHWRFRPAMFQGRAVKVLYSLTVNFMVH